MGLRIYSFTQWICFQQLWEIYFPMVRGILLCYMFSSLFTQNKVVKGLLLTAALQKDKSNPDFWYICIKWFLQAFFSFFWNFVFSGFYGSKSAKKWSKITKNSVCQTHTLWAIHHMIVISGTHVQNDSISRYFFLIFQNFDFLGC